MQNKKLLGNLLLTLTALIWGTAFVFQRVGMDSIEPITFTAARFWLAAAAVGAVALVSAKRETHHRTAQETAKRKHDTLLGGVCCGIFLGTASVFQQMGLVYTTAGKAGFITAMYILIVPVLGFVLFRRKNSWLVWLAVAIGVVGMYLLCVNEGFSLTHGDTLVVICAVLFSGHILCCDHFVQRGDPIGISAIQFLTTAALTTVVSFLVEQPTLDKVVSAALPILYCGLISGGVGYTLQIVAQKFTDPTIASLLMSLESVFAVIAGALLLHETMSTRELIGCIVMFAAIILVQIPTPKKSKKEA